MTLDIAPADHRDTDQLVAVLDAARLRSGCNFLSRGASAENTETVQGAKGRATRIAATLAKPGA